MDSTNRLLTIKTLLCLLIINYAYNYSAVVAQGNASRLNEVTAVVCRDPNGVEGVCINIKQCPTVLKDFVRLVQRRDESYIRYIRQSNAICQKFNHPIICCPLENRVTRLFELVEPIDRNIRGRLITPDEGCGVGKSIPRPKIIYPGFKTEPGVYPWIAMIGYANTLKSPRECVGSLITSRHVLTSAHCITSALSFVRLGVYDLNSISGEHVQDVKVIRSERHADYNKRDRTNDIAILYLEQDVNFTDHIRPICLPVKEPLRNRSFVDYTPFVAAWLRMHTSGKTLHHNSSNVMRDWQLIVLRNTECKDQFKRQGRLISENQFGDGIMCAQVIDAGRMRCQSDSGLMQPIYNHGTGSFSYFLTGIPSYGIGCQASSTPAVYTRVQHFIEWIQEKVEQ